MKKQRAFSIVEILVVIGIVVIVAGISFPAFAAAKESAKQTNCVSNLHQLWAEVAMYRSDYEPAGDSGNMYEMGLPPVSAMYQLANKSPMTCADKKGIGLFGSYDYLPDDPAYPLPFTWSQYTRVAGPSAVIWADFNHNTPQQLTLSEFPKLALGVTVSGNAVRRTASGEPYHLDWWIDTKG